MGMPDSRLNQEILLAIMLEAYQLGTQSADIGPRTIIDRLARDLKPYFSREERTGDSTQAGTSDRQEAAG